MNHLKVRARSAATFLVVALLACGAGTALAQSPHTHQHSFADAEKWQAIFDDPARDAWQKPHEVLTALALEPDMAVADLGAGTGYFSMRLAHFVPQGRVYAVDIEPQMVKHLAERAKQMGLANVTAVQAVADNPELPARVDLVLLVDVYHHIDGREKYFAGLRKSLKPGGRVAVIDFNASAPVGPPVAERLTPAAVREEMRMAGFVLSKEHGFLPNQYFLVFSVRGK